MSESLLVLAIAAYDALRQVTVADPHPAGR